MIKSNNLSIICRPGGEVWMWSVSQSEWVRNIMMEIIPRAGTELLDNEWLGDNMSLWERGRDITICQCQNHSDQSTIRAVRRSIRPHSLYWRHFIFQRFSISEFGARRPCHLPGRTTWYYGSLRFYSYHYHYHMSHFTRLLNPKRQHLVREKTNKQSILSACHNKTTEFDINVLQT